MTDAWPETELGKAEFDITWSQMELGKAEFRIDWGETTMLTCTAVGHGSWEVSVFDLGQAMDEWRLHYESAHTTPEGTA